MTLSIARRMAATSLVTPVAVSFWHTNTPWIGAADRRERAEEARDGRAFAPGGFQYLHLKSEPLAHVDPQVTELAEADASTLSPVLKQLVSAVSQQPVPEEGKRQGRRWWF